MSDFESSYITPRPIKTNNPILLEKPIWRFRRIMTGAAESMKSEIIEMTDYTNELETCSEELIKRGGARA